MVKEYCRKPPTPLVRAAPYHLRHWNHTYFPRASAVAAAPRRRPRLELLSGSRFKFEPLCAEGGKGLARSRKEPLRKHRSAWWALGSKGLGATV